MSLKDSIKQLQKREHIMLDEINRRLGASHSSTIRTHSSNVEIAFGLAFGFSKNNKNIPTPSDKELEKILPWVRKFPIRALQKMGHIPSDIKGADLVRAVFRFMNIGSIEGFNNYYSSTLNSANPQTLAAWIRLGELTVNRTVNEFPVDRKALLSNLKFLRTNLHSCNSNLRNIACEVLQNCGIKIIEVEPFVTAPIPTCAFYWRGTTPVIQLPTTKISDSRFLESIFHSVAHVLYHPMRITCLQPGTPAQHPAEQSASLLRPIENEAKKFAQDTLLSEADECELICCGHFNEPRCIQHFSGLFHVRPGILVERLQQQGKINRRTPLNDFKVAV